jgi:hypothetical protein
MYDALLPLRRKSVIKKYYCYVFSVVQPEMHVDRGPLDDVVEQIRGQPELEEEEMGVSVNVYKPTKSYTGKFNFIQL